MTFKQCLTQTIPLCLAAAAGAAVVWTVLHLGKHPPRDADPSPERSSPVARPGAAAPTSGSQKLVGDWARADGEYVLRVRSIADDGKMDAVYLNPHPVRVASATASGEAAAMRLFVELRDVGYPGCTYTLSYRPAEDVLVGTYYQASLKESFNVAFTRVRGR